MDLNIEDEHALAAILGHLLAQIFVCADKLILRLHMQA